MSIRGAWSCAGGTRQLLAVADSPDGRVWLTDWSRQTAVPVACSVTPRRVSWSPDGRSVCWMDALRQASSRQMVAVDPTTGARVAHSPPGDVTSCVASSSRVFYCIVSDPSGAHHHLLEVTAHAGYRTLRSWRGSDRPSVLGVIGDVREPRFIIRHLLLDGSEQIVRYNTNLHAPQLAWSGSMLCACLAPTRDRLAFIALPTAEVLHAVAPDFTKAEVVVLPTEPGLEASRWPLPNCMSLRWADDSSLLAAVWTHERCRILQLTIEGGEMRSWEGPSVRATPVGFFSDGRLYILSAGHLWRSQPEGLGQMEQVDLTWIA